MKTNEMYVWVTEAIVFENNSIKGIRIISVEKDPKRAVKWIIQQGALRTGDQTANYNFKDEITYKKYNTNKGYRLTKKMIF